MTATQSPFFGINYGWSTGESGWGDPVNTNFKVLSFLGKGAVDIFSATLPPSPSNGDSLVNTTDNQIYFRIGGQWLFITPQTGMELNNIATGVRYRFVSGNWQALVSTSTLQQFNTDLQNSTDPAKGAALVGYKSSTVSARLLNDYVSVLDYGADPTGATDSTAAVMSAAASGRTVKLPAKRDGTKATYKLGLTALPAGTTLFGDGAATELIPLTNLSRGVITVNSASAVTFVDDLSFINLTFRGSVVADGFSEQVHLLTLNGVRNALVAGCRFLGFRGDGLYIGSGDVGGSERHNFNVTVTNNIFDGLNNDNRQGVSIIDCDGLTVDNNTFRNTTRFNMPGAIDIEPDVAAFHVIKNITISNNRFNNIGGNLGVISVFLASSVIPSPDNILITGNTFTNSVTSADHSEIFVGTTRTFVDGDIDSGVIIANNRGRNGCRQLDIRAIKGCTVKDNRFETYTKGSSVGVAALANQAPRNLTMKDNKFIRCATSGGITIAVGSVDYWTNESNRYDDCGNGAAGSYCIDFDSGTSSYLNFRNNTYRSPTGKTLNGIVKEAAHTFTVATNSQVDEKFLNSLSNAFVADETNVALNTYTPIIIGASTAGVGTYTVQFGRWQRVGKMVKYSVHLDVTSHTGTGLIRVSLPVNAVTQTDTTMPMGALTTNGCAGIGVMGVLNSGAVVNGVTGAANAYGYAVGAASFIQIVIPAGAFSVYHEGTYLAS